MQHVLKELYTLRLQVVGLGAGVDEEGGLVVVVGGAEVGAGVDDGAGASVDDGTGASVDDGAGASVDDGPEGGGAELGLPGSGEAGVWPRLFLMLSYLLLGYDTWFGVVSVAQRSEQGV